ncbi:MAG: hypothetical protein ACM358_16290, partial [Gemmatimonadota bacterium]
GQAARFVPMAELPRLDLSPTAAAVLHRAFGAALVRPSNSGSPGSLINCFKDKVNQYNPRDPAPTPPTSCSRGLGGLAAEAVAA